MDCDSDDSDSGHLADADEGLGAKLQGFETAGKKLFNVQERGLIGRARKHI